MSGIDKEKIKQEYGCRFLNLYEYSYEEGGHYYWASRRPKDRLIAPLTLEEHKKIQADAVSCFVVLQVKGEILKTVKKKMHLRLLQPENSTKRPAF